MIGVDVGETRVRVELFDLALTELARTERPLEQQRYEVEVIVDHIRSGIDEVLAAAGLAPERLLGVGIGVPGIVERTADRGAVVHGQTIGWDAVPLESLLRDGSRCPTACRTSSTTGPGRSARPRCGSVRDAARRTPSSSSSAPASAPAWSRPRCGTAGRWSGGT
ncbi:ROK family protein [Streptomyces thermocarboxydus]